MRLANAVLPFGADNVVQIVHYDAGIGVTDNRLERLRGGAFGVGIDTNIKQLYTFLAMNYSPGDEVYMFGFSRGAYTIRSLAGMMHKSGLLRRGELHLVKDAYELYRDRKIKPSHEDAVAFRREHGDRVDITLLACFDTVGALGIPSTLPFPLSLLGEDDRYRFHDTKLSSGVKNGVHAMSIDEDKAVFLPTIMEEAEGCPGQVTETFLAGYHGGVGGGNDEEALLAENALRFVVDEIRERNLGLGFDMSMIPEGGNCEVPVTVRRGAIDRLLRVFTGNGTREVASADRMHRWARQRFTDVQDWRPKALQKIEQDIADTVTREAGGSS